MHIAETAEFSLLCSVAFAITAESGSGIASPVLGEQKSDVALMNWARKSREKRDGAGTPPVDVRKSAAAKVEFFEGYGRSTKQKLKMCDRPKRLRGRKRHSKKKFQCGICT